MTDYNQFLATVPATIARFARRDTNNPHDIDDCIGAISEKMCSALSNGLIPEPTEAYIRTVYENYRVSQFRRGAAVQGSGWFADPYRGGTARQRRYEDSLWTDEVRDPATGVTSQAPLPRALKGRIRPKQVRDAEADFTSVPVDLPDGPEGNAMYAELRRTIRAALSESDYILLLEHVEEQRTFDELAAERDTTASALRGRFFRIRTTLQTVLADWCSSGDEAGPRPTNDSPS